MLRAHTFCEARKMLRAHYTHAYKRAHNLLGPVYAFG